MVVLWPAFVVAGAGVVALFLLSEAATVQGWDIDRTEAVTLAFLFFWGLGAASSAFTRFLMRSADEVNADARG